MSTGGVSEKSGPPFFEHDVDVFQAVSAMSQPFLPVGDTSQTPRFAHTPSHTHVRAYTNSTICSQTFVHAQGRLAGGQTDG